MIEREQYVLWLSQWEEEMTRLDRQRARVEAVIIALRAVLQPFTAMPEVVTAVSFPRDSPIWKAFRPGQILDLNATKGDTNA